MSYWDVPLTHQNLVHMFPNSYFDLIYLSLMIGLLGEFSETYPGENWQEESCHETNGSSQETLGMPSDNSRIVESATN